jgi:hypothetical protein
MSRKKCFWYGILFVAILGLASGCSMARVNNDNPLAVEQVHQGNAIDLSMFKNISRMTGIVISIPGMWLGDGLGIYNLQDEKGNQLTPTAKARKVWQTAVFDSDSVKFFPAVLNKFGTRAIVICPGMDKMDLSGKKLLVLSGSRRFILTTDKKIVKIEPEKFRETGRDSFVKRESLIDLSPSTSQGKQFLEELVREFGEKVIIAGREVAVNTDPKTFLAQLGETNGAGFDEKVARSLPSITLDAVALPQLWLARWLINIAIAAGDETLRGSFFEAKVSGYQAGEVYGNYLDSLESLVSELQLENIKTKRSCLGR